MILLSCGSYICIYIYTRLYTYVHMYIHIYIHVYMFLFFCMYICIYTPTITLRRQNYTQPNHIKHPSFYDELQQAQTWAWGPLTEFPRTVRRSEETVRLRRSRGPCRTGLQALTFFVLFRRGVEVWAPIGTWWGVG